MINFIVANVRRSIFNKIFIVIVLGIVGLECLDIFPELLLVMEKDGNKIIFHETVINLLAIGGSMTLYNLFTITISALPSAGCYCDDMENHFITSILYRSSYAKYSAASMFSCAVSSFLCMVLGEIVFIVLISFLVPLHYEDVSIYTGGWQTLEEGKYLLHIIYVILLRGLRASFFSKE